MRRREFIGVVGMAAAWPSVARAQKAMPVVGFLNGASPNAWKPYLDAFRLGLNDGGYVEGRSVLVEYRWAEGRFEQLPNMAADLVRRQVSLIVSTGGTAATAAAAEATKTIPIVFTLGADPVKLGLIESLNRPGGNLTGVHLFISQMEGKRLGLLRELVPSAGLIAVLLNSNNPNAAAQLKDVQQTARSIGQEIHILHAGTEAELDLAFVTARQVGAGALLVAGDAFFNSRRTYIIALAARHALPAVYEQREHALAGGLMSYGTNLSEGYRQAGSYAARILKGEKPSDLPVMQATSFQFVINLTTAKALGIAVPPMLSARADEVIE
jgi:putative tryptophan/tyrosine transport system substrate-binding protein